MSDVDFARMDELRAVNIVQLNANAFHNIGNVTTIAKLTLESLREASDTEALEYVASELLPALEETHLTLGDRTAEYVVALRQLVDHQQAQLNRQRELLRALDIKLKHISDIIDVQRRMARGDGSPHPTSIADITRDCLRMIVESAKRRGVVIRESIEDTPAVLVDAAQITQVVLNLLKNGMEAMEFSSGERSLEVSVSCRGEESAVVFSVSDRGEGISPQVYEQMFQPGFTTKADHTHSGLGLHFCQVTIERYGGTIMARPRPDGGTCVEFSLASGEDL